MQSDVSNVRASIACLLPKSADITTMSNHAVTVNSKLKKCAQSLLAKMDEEVEQLSISQVILKSPSLNGKSATKPASPKSLFSSATKISASKIDCMQECKFHHQEKGKSLECGMCANQFHRPCVDVKATARPTFWICPSCKNIPKYLMELKETVSDLQRENQTLDQRWKHKKQRSRPCKRIDQRLAKQHQQRKSRPRRLPLYQQQR